MPRTPRALHLSVSLSLLLSLFISASVFTSLHAQPLARVPATSLQLPATPAATSYATTNAFPSLTFTQPVALVSPPRDTRRLFVVEKPGRIWLIPDVTAATPTRTLFLDLTSRVTVTADNNDERGLLALAFHPDFAANGQFFLWYTTTATTTAGGGLHERLSRFLVSSTDPNSAAPDSEQPLITQRDEAGNHNGGELLFGPDGYLYVSLGDEGGGNDQFQNSQRIDRDFFSGILRLDVDRRPGSLAPNPHPAVHPDTYAVPADNPFVGATSLHGIPVNPAALRTEFWAIGLRNPWRMAFDSATGQLWCGDVGQNAREEINLIQRGGNYGWNFREGMIARPGSGAPPAAVRNSFIEPIWDYGRSDGASITGGFVYRGSRYPALIGRYLFADFASGRIWALAPDGENPVTAERVQLLATDTGIASFGLDPATGDILLADHLEGAIKRLVATPASGATSLPETLSATGAFIDTANLTPAAGVHPYEPNVSFWSDHASKRRWFALPDATSQFAAPDHQSWTHPTGAVWVKHFDLELTRGEPATARRIETRFLVKTTDGAYGLTYRWNDAQTDATLVPEEGADQNFTVIENGAARTQTWHFPSRAECLTCHTAAGGHALSFNTRQLNRGDFLETLIASGYLAAPANYTPATPATLPALARADDPSATLEHRARSYLDVNCSQCHQPGGTALGFFDARAAIPLSFAHLINGPLVDNAGDPANRVLVPRDPAHSHLLTRLSVRGLPTGAGAGQMPPIATHERDLTGESLLREWIAALPETQDPSPQTPARLINLAARAQVGPDAELIAGFVIAGNANKRLLIRAVGPTLGTAFGVSGALAAPRLTVFGPDSTTRIAATNSGWSGPAPSPGIAELSAAFEAAGAFRLPPGSSDAALVASLAPGSYTAQVTALSAPGVALVELYDLDPPAPPTTSRLVNLAVRARIGTGDNILIPGLTIAPGGDKTVFIRAVGPGLAQFGVADPLAQPVVTLLRETLRIATNRGWSTAANATNIRATAARVGAFALAENSRDSALFGTLPPGSYTLQVSGANATTGPALVEIYEVP